ncbi:hypothetical protein ACJZTR_02705 [Neorickettsia risticii]|uniref:Transmembrane protein n=1 Tax=Neorickettsia risticii (strain Illinois) TaxID=434131 RepID=C6V5D6_NEORI|nr:hypothetical protein [Neorickettsia risticii]ACT69596.1 hypothetical protein NRI_0627 [Neorickettsia risticii str. Illinois]
MDNPTGKQPNPTGHGNEEQNNPEQQHDNVGASSSSEEEEIFQDAQGAAGGADAQQAANAEEPSSSEEEEIFQEAEDAIGGTDTQQNDPQPPEGEQGAEGRSRRRSRCRRSPRGKPLSIPDTIEEEGEQQSEQDAVEESEQQDPQSSDGEQGAVGGAVQQGTDVGESSSNEEAVSIPQRLAAQLFSPRGVVRITGYSLALGYGFSTSFLLAALTFVRNPALQGAVRRRLTATGRFSPEDLAAIESPAPRRPLTRTSSAILLFGDLSALVLAAFFVLYGALGLWLATGTISPLREQRRNPGPNRDSGNPDDNQDQGAIGGASEHEEAAYAAHTPALQLFNQGVLITRTAGILAEGSGIWYAFLIVAWALLRNPRSRSIVRRRLTATGHFRPEDLEGMEGPQRPLTRTANITSLLGDCILCMLAIGIVLFLALGLWLATGTISLSREQRRDNNNDHQPPQGELDEPRADEAHQGGRDFD